MGSLSQCIPWFYKNPCVLLLREFSIICSIILSKLPVKIKDPGPPLITCDIGGTQFSRSLLDSGVSVNLIPKALYDKYKFVEMKPINVELQLADGSIKKPNGELINVMVRV